MQKRVVNHEIVGYYLFGLITSKLHQKLFEHQRKVTQILRMHYQFENIMLRISSVKKILI